MSESLDRPLSISERMKLKLHFIVCAWCGLYLKQLTTIRSVARMCNNDSQTTRLSAEARDRITRCVNKDLNSV